MICFEFISFLSVLLCSRYSLYHERLRLGFDLRLRYHIVWIHVFFVSFIISSLYHEGLRLKFDLRLWFEVIFSIWECNIFDFTIVIIHCVSQRLRLEFDLRLRIGSLFILWVYMVWIQFLFVICSISLFFSLSHAHTVSWELRLEFDLRLWFDIIFSTWECNIFNLTIIMIIHCVFRELKLKFDLRLRFEVIFFFHHHTYIHTLCLSRIKIRVWLALEVMLVTWNYMIRFSALFRHVFTFIITLAISRKLRLGFGLRLRFEIIFSAWKRNISDFTIYIAFFED